MEEKNRKPKSYQDLEDEVSYDMIQYENGEKEIKDLIESNLRPRVLGNTNPVKLGRCFEFLNNCYGFKHVSTFFQGNQYLEVSEKLFHSPEKNQRNRNVTDVITNNDKIIIIIGYQRIRA